MSETQQSTQTFYLPELGCICLHFFAKIAFCHRVWVQSWPLCLIQSWTTILMGKTVAFCVFLTKGDRESVGYALDQYVSHLFKRCRCEKKKHKKKPNNVSNRPKNQVKHEGKGNSTTPEKPERGRFEELRSWAFVRLPFFPIEHACSLHDQKPQPSDTLSDHRWLDLRSFGMMRLNTFDTFGKKQLPPSCWYRWLYSYVH